MMDKTRLRIRFTKRGDLRWIGHRDLARLWERLLRRANLQLAFSEGFHPKPKISFPSALALGIEALDEIVELEIVGTFQLDEITASIKREMPSGMELLHLKSPAALGKAKVVAASYRIPIPAEEVDSVRATVDRLLAQETIAWERDNKSIVVQISDDHFCLEINDGCLCFTLPNTSSGSLRPSEMLDLCGLPNLLADGTLLQRTAVHHLEPTRTLNPD